MPVVLPRRDVIHLVDDLTDDMHSIAAAVSLTPAHHRVRLEAQCHIEAIVQSVWPTCYVMPFGSCAMGLSTTASDLDVSVMDASGEVEAWLVASVGEALCADPLLRPVERRVHSRGVHLRAVFRGLHVDVLFDQHQALEVVAAVNEFTADHPTFEPLVLTLKALLRRHGVDRAAMSSHVLTMTTMAYVRFHQSAITYHHRDAPAGHTLLYFLTFFRSGGAFDPSSMVLRPHAASGVYTRTPPSPYVMWELRGTDDDRNDAAGCVRIHSVRHIFESVHAHLVGRIVEGAAAHPRRNRGLLRGLLDLCESDLDCGDAVDALGKPQHSQVLTDDLGE